MTTDKQDRLFSMLLTAKAPWDVIPVSHSPVLPGAELTLQRALALRALELPVGEWITEASKLEKEKLGAPALAMLNSNIEDEFRHDRQLTNAFENMELVEDKDGVEEDAKPILKRWLEMGEKYHPAAVAFVAEAGCFIPLLTTFRRLGGVVLANISVDVSRDESLHLRAHKEVGMELAGTKITKELDQLREDTLDWFLGDLVNSGIPGKYGKKRTYMKASHNLVYNGFAPEFKETERATQLAFFEISADNLPVYGSK